MAGGCSQAQTCSCNQSLLPMLSNSPSATDKKTKGRDQAGGARQQGRNKTTSLAMCPPPHIMLVVMAKQNHEGKRHAQELPIWLSS